MATTSTSIVQLLILFLLSFTGVETISRDQPSAPLYFDWQIVNTYPHDPGAFTQGLIYHDGYLYESTGRRGESTLRKVDLETGDILQLIPLEDRFFGEGLTEWNGRLIQLTLSAGVGFIYDMTTFDLENTFSFQGNGWGLDKDNQQLILSDGTPTLRFLDPRTYEEIGELTVTENDRVVSGINELEVIGDRIYANILFSDDIILINPEDGVVTGRVNLEELTSMVEAEATVNVLNGIAYDAEQGRLFVTGKLWPKLFEIDIQITN